MNLVIKEEEKALKFMRKYTRMLDTGCWMLDAGYWMLDTGYWMLEGAQYLKAFKYPRVYPVSRI